MQQQIQSLTGLRFVAAALVCISHALPKMVQYPTSPLWHSLVSTLATEGMTLFFVLSGFVVFYNYERSIRLPGGLRNFVVARFSRLYPLYVVCIAYELLIKYSWAQLSSDQLGALPYYLTLTQSWFYKPIGDHALIYQYGLLAAVSWSISTEAFFYLAFPAICLALTRLRTLNAKIAGLIATFAIGFAVIITLNLNAGLINDFGRSTFGQVSDVPQDSFYRWLLYFSPYIRIFEFVAGCLIASIFMGVAHIKPSAREERIGLAVTSALIVATAALHYVFFGMESHSPWHHLFAATHMNIGFAPLLGGIIFCCARYKNYFTRILNQPKIVLCGEASYSIYMLHFVVINAFRYESPVITAPSVAIGSFLMLGAVIMATLGIAIVSWTLIEMPARRFIRHALARTTVVPAGDKVNPAATV